MKIVHSVANRQEGCAMPFSRSKRKFRLACDVMADQVPQFDGSQFAGRRAGILLLISMLFVQTLPAQQVNVTDPDIDRYVWDLSSLYPDQSAWEAERTTILEKIKTIVRLQGSLGRSAKSLADGLDQVSDLRARGSKMAIYGILVSSVDTRSEKAQNQYDVGTTLDAQVEAAVSFVPSELAAIGEQRLTQWLSEEPRLDRHRLRINRILWEAPHTLPAEEQSLVASMARWPQVSEDVFWALHDSDLNWPTQRNAAGKDVAFNVYSYRSPGQQQERAAFLSRLGSLENAFGLLYTRRIEADLTIARHRKFQDGIDAYWFLRDGMPEGTHRLMVEVARANLAIAHRYFILRDRALGVNGASYADLYTPPTGINRSFLIAEAMNTAISASAPLGPQYQERLRERFDAHWMHLPTWPNKRVTAEIYPPVGGAHPYLIMGYSPTYAKSRAFAGVVTLMMSDAEIPGNRIPDTRDDPATYQNCVIYIGEILHDDYLRSTASNRQERIAFLVNSLDLLWNQYFRWTLVAELDARIQELIIQGKAPSGAQISKMYLDLLREYAGPGVAVDDAFAAEWMTFSIPFESYEHQFWPPAMAAAASIMEGVRTGKINAITAVTGIFGRGDSDRSYLMLKNVGVDLRAKGPYEAVIRRMKSHLDELENLLDQ
jgi:oligoendopeptidase F